MGVMSLHLDDVIEPTGFRRPVLTLTHREHMAWRIHSKAEAFSHDGPRHAGDKLITGIGIRALFRMARHILAGTIIRVNRVVNRDALQQVTIKQRAYKQELHAYKEILTAQKKSMERERLRWIYGDEKKLMDLFLSDNPRQIVKAVRAGVLSPEQAIYHATFCAICFPKDCAHDARVGSKLGLPHIGLAIRDDLKGCNPEELAALKKEYLATGHLRPRSHAVVQNALH